MLFGVYGIGRYGSNNKRNCFRDNPVGDRFRHHGNSNCSFCVFLATAYRRGNAISSLAITENDVLDVSPLAPVCRNDADRPGDRLGNTRSVSESVLLDSACGLRSDYNSVHCFDNPKASAPSKL